MTIAKSLYLSEPILPNEDGETKGNALSCLSQAILKYVVLFIIFNNIFFILCRGEHSRIVEGVGAYHSPSGFSQMPKEKHSLTCFMWSFIVCCSTLLVLCSSLFFFLLCNPSSGKIKRKKRGAKSEC